jgi:DNA-binding SARP family transcriptional activator
MNAARHARSVHAMEHESDGTLSAHLLGPLSIERAGKPIPLGGRAQQALLARLLLDANRTVAIDRLIEDLWGDEAPASAVKMVHIHVSKLRKLLPAGTLVTRAPGYALEIEPEALDMVRFERLRQQGRPHDALELWRGPALAEFDEPFATVESARLDELHLATLEDRIDADLAAGRHPGLVGELEALVARNPLRERLRTQLMLARYRSGRHAEALAGYRDFRELLATELGIEPSAALRDLERRMLQQDPTLELPRTEPAHHHRCVPHGRAHSVAARASRRRRCQLALSA